MFKKILGNALGEVKGGERKIAIAFPLYLCFVFIIAIGILWKAGEAAKERKEAECAAEKKELKATIKEKDIKIDSVSAKLESYLDNDIQDKARRLQEYEEFKKIQNEAKKRYLKR